jgi:hypothetical protein
MLADPTAVNIHQLNPYFFKFCQKVAAVMDIEPDMIKLVQDSFRVRIGLISVSSYGLTTTTHKLRLHNQ